MSYERLQEITQKIVELGDPLAVCAYLTTLSNSDIHLFLNYIKNAKYREMNLYTAVLSFSHDYLRSVNYAMPNSIDIDEDAKNTSKKK